MGVFVGASTGGADVCVASGGGACTQPAVRNRTIIDRTMINLFIATPKCNWQLISAQSVPKGVKAIGLSLPEESDEFSHLSIDG